MSIAWTIIVALFVGAVLVLNRFSPRRILLREILKVISTETPRPSSTYGELELHYDCSWSKDIRTFRDNYDVKRTESIEAEWYPNKQWFFIAYNNGYRNKVVWYIVKNIEERTGKGKYGDGNKLMIASPVPFFGEDTTTEISPHDWRLIQVALTAAKKSVEAFNRNAPTMSISPAH
jgi:hypothetical protein